MLVHSARYDQATQAARSQAPGPLLRSSAAQPGGKRSGINPQCKYDYLPLLDYKGNDMTFESYYNHVKSQDARLREIHGAVPHLRSTVLSDMVADDQGRLPYVFRRDYLFGFLNGVHCIRRRQGGSAADSWCRGCRCSCRGGNRCR